MSIDAPPTTPVVYLIPAGFTGWVTIEFGVDGAPPLPREGGARRVDVPPSGRVQTSSAQEIGIVEHRYFFVDAAGARTPIDAPEERHGAPPDEANRAHDRAVVLGLETGDTSGPDGQRSWFERFYVGTGPIPA